MEAQRNQGLDLLRIIAMFLVVSIHYFGWGGIASDSGAPLLNVAFSGGVAIAANCAVNCFYLISGYHIKEQESLVSAKKRILKVWIPTTIYSVAIPLLLLVVGQITLSAKQMVMLFFAVMGNQYWFSTCFIAMTALTPFFAVMLKNLANTKMLLQFTCVMLFLDCIQPVFGYNAFSNIGYGILHAMTMYTVGYTIKRTKFTVKPWVCCGVYAACVVVICLVTLLSMRLTGDRNRTIADYNSPLMVIESVAFFMFFLNLKVNVKFSILAPYIFGIYLLNDNQYARDFLWKTLFKCDKFYRSPLLPLHYFGVVVCFMLVAGGIEFLRINLWCWVKRRPAIKKITDK